MKRLRQWKAVVAVMLTLLLLFSMPLSHWADAGNAGSKLEKVKSEQIRQITAQLDRAQLPRLKFEAAENLHQLIEARAEALVRTANPLERQAIMQLAAEVAASLEYEQAGLGEEPVYLDPRIEAVGDGELDLIVQFRHDPAEVAVLKAQLRGLPLSFEEATLQARVAHTQFKRELARAGERVHVRHEYSQALNGVALKFPASKLDLLTQSAVVKAVWLDQPVQVEPIEKVQHDEIGITMIGSLPHLGLEQLHELGITGVGIKVGIIDTGLDYHHPDFVRPDGTSVYVGGYDFVDNDDDPMETTYEEWLNSGMPEFQNGRSYYTDHGTHVTGTVAGQGTHGNVDYAVKGVAPDVEIYAYRVLGPYGSGYTSAVLAGIDRSVAEGLDVINLSLGNTLNDPLFITSLALNNAMLMGTVAVTSAGNSGPGYYTVGSPGTSALALTVGGSDLPMATAETTGMAAGESYHLPLLGYNTTQGIDGMIALLQDQSFPIVNVGLGSKEELAELDLSGKIAFIKRGDLPFIEKMANAKEAGAVAAIIWNSSSGYIPYYFGDNFTFLPTFNMSNEDGERLLAAIEAAAVDPDPSLPGLQIEKLDQSRIQPHALAEERFQRGLLQKENPPRSNPIKTDPIKGNPIKGGPGKGNPGSGEQPGAEALLFNFGQFEEMEKPGDYMYGNSSRGPVNKLFLIKPDVVAPGVDIFSTIPAYIHDPENQDYTTAYARYSGTSMASPHAAGLAALVLQVNPAYSPFDVKTAIMNSAVPMAKEYNLFDLGAGRIAPYGAVMNQLRVQVEDETLHIVDEEEQVIPFITGSISFGEAKGTGSTYRAERTVRIYNDSTETKELTLHVQYLAPTMPEMADAIINQISMEVPTQLSVPAGESISFTAGLNIPADADEGVYQGYILLAEGEQNYRIPFAVLYGYTGQVGIEYVTMDPLAFSPDGDGYMDYTNIYFSYYSQMETTDILLWSPDGPRATQGYVGYIGFIDSPIPPGQYRITGGWDGYYFPFDENGNLLPTPVKAEDGFYTIDFYAYDDAAQEYSAWGDVFVDTVPPEVELSLEPGSHELPAGEEHILSGTVIDTELFRYRDAGYNVDQSLNQVFLVNLNTYDFIALEVDGEGNFAHTFTLEAGETINWLFSVEDFAGNYVDHYYDLTGLLQEEEPREGAIHIQLPMGDDGTERRTYSPGESFTFAIKAENLEHLFTSQLTLAYDEAVLELINIDVHPEVRQLAEESGKLVQFFQRQEDGHPETHPNHTLTTGVFTLLGQGGAISGDMALYEVTMQVQADASDLDVTELFIYEARYVNPLAQVVQLLLPGEATEENGALKSFTVTLPVTTSMITGNVLPEAFTTNGSRLLPDLDLQEKKIRVEAISLSTDEVFTGAVIDEEGHFAIEVPHHDQYGIRIEVPGHFIVHPDVPAAQVQVEAEDVVIGSPFKLKAGDVTHDDVVDLVDLFYVAIYFDLEEGNINGINTRVLIERIEAMEAAMGIALDPAEKRVLLSGMENLSREDVDINQDGRVDMFDLALVILNYGCTNPYALQVERAEVVLPAQLPMRTFLQEFLPMEQLEQLERLLDLE